MEDHVALLKKILELLSTPEPSRNILEVKELVSSCLLSIEGPPIDRSLIIQWVDRNFDKSDLSSYEKIELFMGIYNDRIGDE